MGFLGHVDEMHAKGVVGVINMCGEYRGPLEDYKRLGIEELWLPTVVRDTRIQQWGTRFKRRSISRENGGQIGLWRPVTPILKPMFLGNPYLHYRCAKNECTLMMQIGAVMFLWRLF